MDIYEELGLTPFINAYRPLTRLGGATLPRAVSEAMCQASRKNIRLRTMQQKVGAAIAAMTCNEAAYVSCGAISGIMLAVAACMAGTDPELSERLPDARGMRNEVVMQSCDRGLKSDVGIRSAGAQIVTAGDLSGTTEQDLKNAIGDRTAAIFAHAGPSVGKLSVSQLVAIGRKFRVPVLIDAAFSVPPKETLWRFTRDGGADAIFVSGGKGLRGPQSTGLVLGKSWIIDACAFHGSPNDRIGRGMKVGKEELAGIYAAVKLFIESDAELDKKTKEKQLEYIIAQFQGGNDVNCEKVNGTQALVRLDTRYNLSPFGAARWLLASDPSIYCESCGDGLIIRTESLEDGDEIIIAQQLGRMIKEAQSKPEGWHP
jgi:uncharacterized pyridoxal phosphate-dependent enzyme